MVFVLERMLRRVAPDEFFTAISCLRSMDFRGLVRVGWYGRLIESAGVVVCLVNLEWDKDWEGFKNLVFTSSIIWVTSAGG